MYICILVKTGQGPQFSFEFNLWTIIYFRGIPTFGNTLGNNINKCLYRLMTDLQK